MFKSYRKWLADFCTILNFATSHLSKVSLSLCRQSVFLVWMLYTTPSWRMAEFGITRSSVLVATLTWMARGSSAENWRLLPPRNLTLPMRRNSSLLLPLKVGLQPHLLLSVDLFYCVSGVNGLSFLTAQLHHYICNVNPHLPPLFLNVCSKQYKQFQRWVSHTLMCIVLHTHM